MVSNVRYTVGRFSAVAARPLCLFLADNYLAPGAAANLAVTILATSLALVVTAADTHRRYYVREFEVEKRSNSVVFYVYVASLILLSAVGAVFVTAMVYYFTKSASVAAAGCLYFGAEKLADEALRHKLFERAFTSWGNAAIARGFLQVSGIVAAVALGGSTVPSPLLISILAIGALVVFVPGTPLHIARQFIAMRWTTTIQLSRRAVAAIRDGWILWAIAVLGASMAYVDRIIALLIATDLLPLFMLVVMAFSVLQMSVDFYYISGHRTNFLQGRISIKGVFTSAAFLRSLFGGLAAAALCCVALLSLSKNGAAFPVSYIVAIALLQISAVLTAAPFQILYWRGELKRILLTEVGFWVLLAAAALVVRAAGWPLPAMFGAVVACSVIRLAVYVAELAAPARVEARS